MKFLKISAQIEKLKKKRFIPIGIVALVGLSITGFVLNDQHSKRKAAEALEAKCVSLEAQLTDETKYLMRITRKGDRLQSMITDSAKFNAFIVPLQDNLVEMQTAGDKAVATGKRIQKECGEGRYKIWYESTYQELRKGE